MKKKMVFTTIFLFFGLALFLPIYIVTKNHVIETIAITIGITFYHFAMRLAVGTFVNLIMKNRANHNNVWFCEKPFEKRVFKALGVRNWKRYIPTYDMDTFNANKKTVKELIGATCQAEIVHEIIMVLSLLPITLIPFLGGTIAIIITSVLALLIDLVFVILQRYNRPKLIKVMGRFDKIKQ